MRADASAEDVNPLCGDQIRMELLVKDGTVARRALLR